MANLLKITRAQSIKKKASELGFFHCSISQVDFLEQEAKQLEEWLNHSYNGKMAYMENHFDKRLNPALLVEDSKSVITLLFNYYSDKKQVDSTAPKISKYAFGEDYHYVVKDKLKQLLEFIESTIGEVHGRAFVDSAPVMDKAWAKKSGAGWMGKHSNIINKQNGSFFFIAELIIDLELQPDGPIKDYCGTCTRCIDACPTDAIVQPYVVDGSKCISYLTIELKDALLPAEFRHKMDNWMFGCDICQDVCPWNRFSKAHNEPRFEPHQDLLNLQNHEWHDLTEDLFNELFKVSPVKRTKYDGLKRNIRFLNKKD
jgi:epoxyqueuosine reductase